MSLSLVNVVGGPWTNANGSPLAGASVQAVLSATIRNGGDSRIQGTVVSTVTSGTGNWQLPLVSTLDPNTSPENAYWTITCEPAGFSAELMVPATSGSIAVEACPPVPGSELPLNVVTDSSVDGPSAGQYPEYTGVGRETTPGNPGGGGGNPVTVNGALTPAALAVTQQPVCPPSGIIQPLPPLFGFQFPGASVSYALGGGANAYGICAGRDGNLWAADSNNAEVWQITPAGAIASFALPGNTPSICSGPDGNLWANGVGVLARITPAGVVTDFSSSAPGNSFEGICAGPDGNLWAGDDNAQVWQITTDGVATAFPAGSIDGPVGICVGPDGNLWVPDYNSQVVRVTPEGVATAFPLTGANPFGACAGADGNVWLGDQSGGTGIWRVTPAGETTNFPITSDGFDGLCAGAGGDVWAVSGSNLWKITPEGVGTSFAIAGAEGLTWLCSGPDGSLWLTGGGSVFNAPFYAQLGGLIFTALPTSDPHIAGVPYSGALGALFVSEG